MLGIITYVWEGVHLIYMMDAWAEVPVAVVFLIFSVVHDIINQAFEYAETDVRDCICYLRSIFTLMTISINTYSLFIIFNPKFLDEGANDNNKLLAGIGSLECHPVGPCPLESAGVRVLRPPHDSDH